MNVLVTGAAGLLGAHLMAACSRQHDVVGVDRHPWWGDQPMRMLLADLSEPRRIEEAVSFASPEVLIHCAALVNVDACERDPDEAYALNAQLTRALLGAVSPRCLVVYISTDGLFDGHALNVDEQEPPSPLTVYAKSKLQGEWEVRQAAKNHLIVRTNFYGWSSGRKETAAEWLYRSLETGKPVTLFNDFFFSPIYVIDFAERLMRLIDSSHRGLVHLAGGERVSKYQFGELMAGAAGCSMANVRQGSIDDARLAAPRPKDMSLNSSLFSRVTGMDVPGCLAGLRRFLHDRTRPLSERVEARQRVSEEASI